jgi:hypothetical protein
MLLPNAGDSAPAYKTTGVGTTKFGCPLRSNSLRLYFLLIGWRTISWNQTKGAQLGAMPVGTRPVTYTGYTDEIPACYDCESALFRDELKLWIKRREYDADTERLALQSSRSYRGPIG